MKNPKGLYENHGLVLVNRTKDSAYFSRFSYYGKRDEEGFSIDLDWNNRIAPVELTQW